MNTLRIVWRNPNAVGSHRRRHSFLQAKDCALYIMQEFVQDGLLSYWTTVSGLEVVTGGRVLDESGVATPAA